MLGLPSYFDPDNWEGKSTAVGPCSSGGKGASPVGGSLFFLPPGHWFSEKGSPRHLNLVLGVQ